MLVKFFLTNILRTNIALFVKKTFAEPSKKLVFGMPSREDYYEAKYHFQGCIPDFPKPRTWGCCNCDAAFFKDTPRNRAALGGLVPHQWPKD